jgi:rare lipoprotein A
MVQPNQHQNTAEDHGSKRVSMSEKLPTAFPQGPNPAWKAVIRTTDSIEQTLRDIPDAVASTARIIISAEERLRQRVRSTIRVTLATLFLGISGLISLGANVSMAFAKKVSPESTRDKRTKGHSKTRYHLRNSGMLISEYGMTADESSGSLLKSLHTAKRHTLHGVASWYGRQFDHRRTASGVRFNTHKMMAAHRTLPFGTKVKVTNLRNHKSCVVEITDRGPYVSNRVIDLSYVAAQQIGLTETGTAEVALEVLSSKKLPVDVSVSPDIADGLQSYSPERTLESIERVTPVFDGIPAYATPSIVTTVAER